MSLFCCIHLSKPFGINLGSSVTLLRHYVPVKSRLQHPPREFDRFNLPWSGEFEA